MTTFYPRRGVWRVEGTGAGTKVVIPYRFQGTAALCWACVLAAWGYGGVFLFMRLITWEAESLFIVALPMFFVWASLGRAFSFAWFAGCGLAHEAVWREGAALCVRNRCVGLPWGTWRYSIEDIGSLRAPARRPRVRAESEGGSLVVSDDDRPLRPDAEEDDSGAEFRAGGVSGGVAFRCRGKESFIGAGLDEGQAARLAEVLALRFGLRLGTGPSGV